MHMEKVISKHLKKEGASSLVHPQVMLLVKLQVIVLQARCSLDAQINLPISLIGTWSVIKLKG